MRFLKSKDSDEKDCENDEKIEYHELDEDIEFEDKINYILENENDVKIFDEVESSDYYCNFCEKTSETEIQLVSHLWKVTEESQHSSLS